MLVLAIDRGLAELAERAVELRLDAGQDLIEAVVVVDRQRRRRRTGAVVVPLDAVGAGDEQAGLLVQDGRREAERAGSRIAVVAASRSRSRGHGSNGPRSHVCPDPVRVADAAGKLEAVDTRRHSASATSQKSSSPQAAETTKPQNSGLSYLTTLQRSPSPGRLHR